MLRRSLAVVVVGVGWAVACGGSAASVDNNTTNGTLQRQKDGSATGTGSTCSWSGTALSDSTGQKDTTTYSVGASFNSLDGCNTCSCTAQGISCTEKGCGGSSSSSSSGGQACQADAMVCPDGTTLGRTGPNCTFPACPTTVPCPDLAKECPDGTVVGATGPKCEFICPAATCEQLAMKARSELDAVLKANSECDGDEQCATIAYSSHCFDSCSRGINKKGVDPYNKAVNNANANECKAFQGQGCTFPIPPCVAPQPPKCSGHKCQ